MSLAGKWEEWREKLGRSLNAREDEMEQRAFYAGAEACLDHPGNPNEIQAEIDEMRAGRGTHSERNT